MAVGLSKSPPKRVHRAGIIEPKTPVNTVTLSCRELQNGSESAREHEEFKQAEKFTFKRVIVPALHLMPISTTLRLKVSKQCVSLGSF